MSLAVINALVCSRLENQASAHKESDTLVIVSINFADVLNEGGVAKTTGTQPTRLGLAITTRRDKIAFTVDV